MLVERRPPTLGSVAVTGIFYESAAQLLEIHRRIENLQRVAMRAQRLKMFRKAEKAPLIHDPPPCPVRTSESQAEESG